MAVVVVAAASGQGIEAETDIWQVDGAESLEKQQQNTINEDFTLYDQEKV